MLSGVDLASGQHVDCAIRPGVNRLVECGQHSRLVRTVSVHEQGRRSSRCRARRPASVPSVGCGCVVDQHAIVTLMCGRDSEGLAFIRTSSSTQT